MRLPADSRMWRPVFRQSLSLRERVWREAPGEGLYVETLGMPALIRPFLDARPIGLALRAGHLLPEGEGLACGFPRLFGTALTFCRRSAAQFGSQADRFKTRYTIHPWTNLRSLAD